MKKFFFLSALIASLMVLTCCSDDMNSPQETVVNQETSSLIRSPKEAIEIAESSMNTFGFKVSRSSSPSVVVKYGKTSRSEDLDTILYIVNFGESDGYAIISAPKTVTPLLAITDQGNIEDVNNIDNPGVNLFMNAASTYSNKDLILQPIKPLEKQEVKTEVITLAEVTPRVKVKWGQRWPEGKFCPNSISGCIPTACAQALSFLEFPTSINLTYKGQNSIATELYWLRMRSKINSKHSIPSGANINSDEYKYHAQLAHLCREIGYRIGAEYSSNGTYAASEDLYDFLLSFQPDLKLSKYNYGNPDPVTDLEDGVILMSGYDDSGAGHQWVVDGYNKTRIITRYYTVNVLEGTTRLDMTTDYTYSYHHINWGWRGTDNGYFLKDVFSPANLYYIDDDVDRLGEYNFTKGFEWFRVSRQYF